MDDKFYQKYLKYKNRYLNLKNALYNNIQHGGSHKMKILIVVDVQNCFLEDFGTYAWQPIQKLSPEQRIEIINLYKKNLHDLIDYAKKHYDLIIFTKDSHPLDHGSFKYINGIHPPHCIDPKKGKICGRESKRLDDSTIIINQDLAKKRNERK